VGAASQEAWWLGAPLSLSHAFWAAASPARQSSRRTGIAVARPSGKLASDAAAVRAVAKSAPPFVAAPYPAEPPLSIDEDGTERRKAAGGLDEARRVFALGELCGWRESQRASSQVPEAAPGCLAASVSPPPHRSPLSPRASYPAHFGDPSEPSAGSRRRRSKRDRPLTDAPSDASAGSAAAAAGDDDDLAAVRRAATNKANREHALRAAGELREIVGHCDAVRHLLLRSAGLGVLPPTVAAEARARAGGGPPPATMPRDLALAPIPRPPLASLAERAEDGAAAAGAVAAALRGAAASVAAARGRLAAEAARGARFSRAAARLAAAGHVLAPEGADGDEVAGAGGAGGGATGGRGRRAGGGGALAASLRLGPPGVPALPGVDTRFWCVAGPRGGLLLLPDPTLASMPALFAGPGAEAEAEAAAAAADGRAAPAGAADDGGAGGADGPSSSESGFDSEPEWVSQDGVGAAGPGAPPRPRSSFPCPPPPPTLPPPGAPWPLSPADLAVPGPHGHVVVARGARAAAQCLKWTEVRLTEVLAADRLRREEAEGWGRGNARSGFESAAPVSAAATSAAADDRAAAASDGADRANDDDDDPVGQWTAEGILEAAGLGAGPRGGAKAAARIAAGEAWTWGGGTARGGREESSPSLSARGRVALRASVVRCFLSFAAREADPSCAFERCRAASTRWGAAAAAGRAEGRRLAAAPNAGAGAGVSRGGGGDAEAVEPGRGWEAAAAATGGLDAPSRGLGGVAGPTAPFLTAVIAPAPGAEEGGWPGQVSVLALVRADARAILRAEVAAAEDTGGA